MRLRRQGGYPQANRTNSGINPGGGAPMGGFNPQMPLKYNDMRNRNRFAPGEPPPGGGGRFPQPEGGPFGPPRPPFDENPQDPPLPGGRFGLGGGVGGWGRTNPGPLPPAPGPQRWDGGIEGGPFGPPKPIPIENPIDPVLPPFGGGWRGNPGPLPPPPGPQRPWGSGPYDPTQKPGGISGAIPPELGGFGGWGRPNPGPMPPMQMPPRPPGGMVFLNRGPFQPQGPPVAEPDPRFPLEPSNAYPY